MACCVTRLGALLPACVEARVNEFRDTWVPPEKGKGTVGGIRVYLALTESSDAVTIARELLEDPTTHIGLVVDQNTHWKDLFGDVADRVRLISRDALLADPEVLERNEATCSAPSCAATPRAGHRTPRACSARTSCGTRTAARSSTSHPIRAGWNWASTCSPGTTRERPARCWRREA